MKSRSTKNFQKQESGSRAAVFHEITNQSNLGNGQSFGDNGDATFLWPLDLLDYCSSSTKSYIHFFKSLFVVTDHDLKFCFIAPY